MASLLIRGGTIVTMDSRQPVLKGDVYVEDGEIKAVGEEVPRQAQLEIDATGQIVLPGLVQSHIHLCQTLFRGLADNLTLLHWLKDKIWPLEAAHDEKSVYYSALLGCAELVRAGTTSVLDMETVHHCDRAFEAARDIGIRATIGKAMMDEGENVPTNLLETTNDSLLNSEKLRLTWHETENGRLRYAYAPRFALSCSEDLLREVSKLSQEHDIVVHTHAAENPEETKIVRKQKGMPNVNYFDELGLTGPRLALAHCVHLDSDEFQILAKTQTNVLHCPTSNLKLGSGIANVSLMLEMGIPVSLGSDGAACNNNLDMFQEMRLAALLLSRIAPGQIQTVKILEMATLGGARALGLQHQIGSIEKGKRADLCILDIRKSHARPTATNLELESIVNTIVWTSKAEDVQTTIVDGRVLMRDRTLVTINEEAMLRKSDKCIQQLVKRADIS